MTPRIQTSTELTKDQILNFFINTIDEKVQIDSGENADLERELLAQQFY